MPVYIALLRGINIGPHKRMKMEKLREGCEGLNLSSVKTYVQSGNIVFRAAKCSPESLSKKLENMIVQQFGFTSRVVIRTDDEVASIVRNNPFQPAANGPVRSNNCMHYLAVGILPSFPVGQFFHTRWVRQPAPLLSNKAGRQQKKVFHWTIMQPPTRS